VSASAQYTWHPDSSGGDGCSARHGGGGGVGEQHAATPALCSGMCGATIRTLEQAAQLIGGRSGGRRRSAHDWLGEASGQLRNGRRRTKQLFARTT